MDGWRDEPEAPGGSLGVALVAPKPSGMRRYLEPGERRGTVPKPHRCHRGATPARVSSRPGQQASVAPRQSKLGEAGFSRDGQTRSARANSSFHRPLPDPPKPWRVCASWRRHQLNSHQVLSRPDRLAWRPVSGPAAAGGGAPAVTGRRQAPHFSPERQRRRRGQHK